MELKIGDLIYYPYQKSLGIILNIYKNHLGVIVSDNQWLSGWKGDVPTEPYTDTWDFTVECRRRLLELTKNIEEA